MTTVLIVGGKGLKGMKSALEDAGYEVREATKTVEVFDRVKKGEVDVIIVDSNMPTIKTNEMLPGLRRITKIPIIVVGRGGEHALVQSLKAGADYYVSRLVSQQELVERVRALLRREQWNENKRVRI